MILRVATLLLVLAGCAHAWAYRAFQPDDTFIFLVYAKNLLAGNGLTFNGELVEGFSSPLWLMLVSLVASTGLDLLVTAKAMGVGLYLLTGVVLAATVRFVQDDETTAPWRSLAAPVIYFALPMAALWSVAGMETTFYALLLLAACALYFRASLDEGSARHYAWAGAAFGLVAWTRPEGIAFVGTVLAIEACKLLLRRRVQWRGVGLLLAVAVGMMAVLVACRYLRYGELLPSTVLAKTGDLASQWYRGKVYLQQFVSAYGLFIAAYAAATVVLLARGGRAAWWAWLALVVVAGNTLFCAMTGGDWMLGYRFLMPVVPLAVSVMGLAVVRLRWPGIAAAAALAAAGITMSVPFVHVARVQATSDLGDIHMGRYIAGLGLPPASKIAVLDAGAIPYYSGLPSIDMVGLNNLHISSRPGGFMGKWDNEYVLSQQPAVIQFHTRVADGEVYPAPVFTGTVRLYYSREFQRWYRFDEASPVMHLYRRRAVPLASTFMDTFHDAQLRIRSEDERVRVKVSKLGDGYWVAGGGDWLQMGAFYVRLRAMTPAGTIESERHLALPRAMRKGETLEVDAQLKAPAGGSLQACLVQVAVADDIACAQERPPVP